MRNGSLVAKKRSKMEPELAESRSHIRRVYRLCGVDASTLVALGCPSRSGVRRLPWTPMKRFLVSSLLCFSLGSWAQTVFQATPLTDFQPGQLYLSKFSGFLYSGSNRPPTGNDSDGKAKAALVQPLDNAGNPSATGKIVLLSIGMSNTTDEWCDGSASEPCTANSFMGKAAMNSTVNHATLVIKDGAYGGQDAKMWACATGNCPPGTNHPNNYDRVRDRVLTPAGLTEAQVEAIWLKEADASPTVSLPSSSADAYVLERYLGQILRAVELRYPNCQQVFLSSRIYAGYAKTSLNPEPYAYESGFAVKWLIRAQVTQINHNGTVIDKVAGDLNYKTGVAPWATWGPYLWASDSTPRSDGLMWSKNDFQSDGTHPSTSGVTKVGSMLMNYFLNSPYTTWFRSSGK